MAEGETPGGEEKPENGEKAEKEPGDPDKRTTGDQSEDEGATGDARRAGQPAWIASLPAQIRDALVRGDYESIPARYRKQVREYIKWLQAEEGRSSR